MMEKVREELWKLQEYIENAEKLYHGTNAEAEKLCIELNEMIETALMYAL